MDVDARAATAVIDGEHHAHQVSLEDAVALEPQLALQRERLAGERDCDQQHERRRHDRELRASRDERRQ